MDTTTLSSHAVSALLHTLFLLLAFMAPATLLLEPMPDWARSPRVVQTDLRDVVVETGFHRPRTLADFAAKGDGGVPETGSGDEAGPKARTRATSSPPDPKPQIAADTPDRFVSDVGELLGGFASQTLGPDASNALGALDDGGGGRTAVGWGGFGRGGGASCWGSWRELPNGKMLVKRRPCPKAPTTRSVSTRCEPLWRCRSDSQIVRFEPAT